MADHAALKKMRPWYFVIAMCLTWVSGVVTATSSCKTVSYLRGDQEMDITIELEAESMRL